HLAAFMVGAAALLGARWVEGRRVRRADATNSGWTRADLLTAALMMLIGSAVQFSGGRIGVALLVLVLVIVAFRAGLRAAIPVAVAIVLGLGIAAVALPADGSGATDRVNSASSSSISGRIDRWAMAVDAVADRPIVGIGPGLYRRATSPYDTVAAASAFGSDRLNRDAHNVFVEYLVTTGMVGLLALVVWLALASRRARGPLAAFALGGSLSLLLQPLWIGLTPVLALALGAADRRELVPFRRPSAIAAGVIGVVGDPGTRPLAGARHRRSEPVGASAARLGSRRRLVPGTCGRTRSGPAGSVGDPGVD
ncbi:MAG: O-antigen ligase family protein, partial [Acidimicrobiia bacterium]|nr:O-antigen ligase family protein [Acidimicrobiia bacterium]